MKKTIRLLIALLIFLTLNIAVTSAQPIEPSGEKVGFDAQGVAIYQLPANDIKIGYKLMGTGEPLVMIPGLGNTMDVWPKEIVDTLARKYQLIMLDNRGMGHSTSNDTPFSYQLFADDVVGLLDALGVKKANVLGFSMGSTITQKLLLEYPQRFNKAVIYATTTDGSGVAGTLKKMAHENSVVMNKVNPTVLRQLEASARWRTPLDRMQLITNQVMFLVGTNDPVVGAESSKTLAAAVPGAWLIQFKNGTHGVMRETPGEFARIVLTFFEINETVPVK